MLNLSGGQITIDEALAVGQLALDGLAVGAKFIGAFEKSVIFCRFLSTGFTDC